MICSIELPPLYRLQQEIADDPHRFKVIAAGRRFGKTLLCVEISFRKAFEGKRVWWVAHNYSTAGIAFRMTMALVKQLPDVFGIKVNIATRTILFTRTGGEFSFKSSDRPDNLRGEALDHITMDEADFHKKNVWYEILRPALADRRGSAIFISTPKYENGWFHQMWKEGQKGKSNIKSWRCSSYTNPYLSHEELDEIRETTPDITFRQEILAEFISGEGARVKSESIQYCDIDEIKFNEDVYFAVGADLAIGEKEINDYTSVCVLAKNIKTGEIYICDIKRDRLSFAKQKEMIKAYAEKWNKYTHNEIIIGIEEVGYQKALIQEVARETGFAVFGIPANKNKVARFASLEAKYELRQIYHAEDLPLSFEAELLAFPEGEHDDYEDSMSVAYAALNRAFGFTDSDLIFELGEKSASFF